MSETLNSLASRTAGDCASLIEQESLENWHERSEGMCPVILSAMEKSVAEKGKVATDLWDMVQVRVDRIAELDDELETLKRRTNEMFRFLRNSPAGYQAYTIWRNEQAVLAYDQTKGIDVTLPEGMRWRADGNGWEGEMPGIESVPVLDDIEQVDAEASSGLDATSTRSPGHACEGARQWVRS